MEMAPISKKHEHGGTQTKRKFTKVLTFCMICFILLAPLSIFAEYSARENGDVMAGTPEPNRIYTIGTQNVNNRVFDFQNAQTADNSVVWTYPYNGDECQEWRFIKHGSDYAIQDTHSDKYLTVKNNSSSTDAEVVISSRPSSGYSTGQLFRVEQIGTSMRYRLLTKCSNYTLAIGFNSSYYLRQYSPSTNGSVRLYLTESAPYHGLQEGSIHIQQYNTEYAINDKMLGCDSSYGTVSCSPFNNSELFEWYAKYEGGRCFSILQDGGYLSYSGASVGASLSIRGSFSKDKCLWKIIKTGNYYHIAPKNAVSNGTASIVLGISSNAPNLVASSNQTGRWRIIRSHYYYNYDLTIYAAEDFSHNTSHAYIFNYACPALYLRGYDNQNLLFTTGATPALAIDDVEDVFTQSDILTLMVHGSQDHFILNARDSLGRNLGGTLKFELSDINGLAANSLRNLDCALLISCHSAEGEYTNSSSSNFVRAIVGKGASCAIGFDGLADCAKVQSFTKIIFEYYSEHYGSQLILMRDAFYQAISDTRGLGTESYKPFFYDVCGNTAKFSN